MVNNQLNFISLYKFITNKSANCQYRKILKLRIRLGIQILDFSNLEIPKINFQKNESRRGYLLLS